MTVWNVPATVVRLHDGDTLTADLDLGWHVAMTGQSVRLARINAPELATDAGKTALAFLEALVKAGDKVTLTSHSLDKYGRVLADVVTTDGTNLSDAMIASGNAAPWDGKGVKPVPPAPPV